MVVHVASPQGGFGMRTVAILSVVGLLSTCVGCGPSVPGVRVTKELNELSARELIKSRLTEETYKIPVDGVSELFARTLTDYRTLTAPTGRQAELKRLLDKGLVLQTAGIASYPRISGTFKYRSQVGNEQMREYHIEMLPNSNFFTGEFVVTYCCPESSNRSRARGTVRPDGTMEFQEGGWYGYNRTYREEGSAAYLIFPGQQYEGTATGRRVDLRSYTYSWSPGFQKQLVRSQNATFLPGGRFEVGEVSGLRLVTDTEATAKFAWKASLNDLGKLFFASQAPAGASEATFGKKPDGTWFVDRLGISD
jgi:hypothetical protein